MARQYAPALTKAEFLQRRPGGKYQNYLNYLEANRPGWKAPQALRPQHVPPPMRGPLPTYESLLRRNQILTPAQMEAQANRMAQTQLESQRKIMQEEYRRSAEDAMNRMRAFQVAGNQAAAMNASLIGQVGSQYQAGADQLNAMAAGGSSMMAGATQADVSAANQALGNVGAPALSVGGPVGAPGIAGDTQAGVEGYRGGTLPANAMQTEGGYASAGMAGQISSQNLRATQEAQAAYMQAIGEADRNKASAIKELVAGRPQLAMQFLQQLQDNQRQAIALSQGLIASSQQKKQQGFENKVTTTKLNADLRQQQIENQQFNQKMQAAAQANAIDMNRVDASASRAWGYLVNKAGQPILNKNKQPIPVASSASGGKGGMTAYQLSRLMPKAQDAASALYYGQKVVNGKRVNATDDPNFDPDDPSTYGTNGLDYGPALQRLRRMGVPAGTARSILNDYYKPGEAGRAIFEPNEVAALKKHYGPKHYKWFLDNIKRANAAGDLAEAQRWRNLALSGQNPGWSTLKA